MDVMLWCSIGLIIAAAIAFEEVLWAAIGIGIAVLIMYCFDTTAKRAGRNALLSLQKAI
jgi:hypothetical protein